MHNFFVKSISQKFYEIDFTKKFEKFFKKNVAFIQKAKLFLRQMIFTDAFVHIFDVKEHCLVAVLNVLFAF